MASERARVPTPVHSKMEAIGVLLTREIIKRIVRMMVDRIVRHTGIRHRDCLQHHLDDALEVASAPHLVLRITPQLNPASTTQHQQHQRASTIRHAINNFYDETNMSRGLPVTIL